MKRDNIHRHASGRRKAGRGGKALLSGLRRCRRCGRRLNTTYSGSARLAPDVLARLQTFATAIAAAWVTQP